MELFYCTFVLGDMYVYCHIGLSLIVLFSLCAKKKKEKKKKKIYIYIYMRTCMYSVSVFLKYVYGFMRIIVLSVCITCGSSYVSFPRSQYHVLTLRFY